MGSAHVLRPVAGAVPDDGAPTGPVAWRKYTRDEGLDAVNVVAQGWDRQVGIVDRPDQVVLFVTLDKRGRPKAQRYEDRFLSASEFQWQSRNRNAGMAVRRLPGHGALRGDGHHPHPTPGRARPMTEGPCPFCPPPHERVFFRGERVLAVWDAFPATPGHALIIPRRHLASSSSPLVRAASHGRS